VAGGCCPPVDPPDYYCEACRCFLVLETDGLVQSSQQDCLVGLAAYPWDSDRVIAADERVLQILGSGLSGHESPQTAESLIQEMEQLLGPPPDPPDVPPGFGLQGWDGDRRG
jgi:hypothetical protein